MVFFCMVSCLLARITQRILVARIKVGYPFISLSIIERIYDLCPPLRPPAAPHFVWQCAVSPWLVPAVYILF